MSRVVGIRARNKHFQRISWERSKTGSWIDADFAEPACQKYAKYFRSCPPTPTRPVWINYSPNNIQDRLSYALCRGSKFRCSNLVLMSVPNRELKMKLSQRVAAIEAWRILCRLRLLQKSGPQRFMWHEVSADGYWVCLEPVLGVL